MVNAQQADFRSRPDYIRDHFAHVETLPFDGLALATISGAVLMNGVPRSYAEIATDFAPVRGLPFVRLKHNLATINVDRPADFFGDWSITVENFRLFARVLRESGIEGIFFDNEEYRGHLFDYPEDCAEKLKSLAEYQEQARLRGREIMQAMIGEYPGIVFLVLHGPYSSFSGTPDEVRRGQTDAQLEELRGAFSVGLMEGMDSRARFVDGGAVYAYRSTEDFQVSYDYRKNILGSEAADCPFIPRELRPVWPSKLHVAFGVYNGPFAGEEMNPMILRSTLERALARCDEFVWLYTEDENWNAPGEISTDWIDAVIAAKAAASEPPSDPAPWVSITSPATGSTFVNPRALVLRASASAGERIFRKVEFFDGVTKLGEALSAPYEFEWVHPVRGAYALTAHATDEAGAMSISGAVTVNVSETFKANINFQPSTVTTPIQYFADSGKVFASQVGGLVFGWNVDHFENMRDNAGSTDLRRDTLCQMRTGAQWEIALPNGNYHVTVGVGDGTFASKYTINVEGVSYWASEPLLAGQYVSQTKTVGVADGRLTIDQRDGGYEETRIDYVLIAAAESVPAAPSGLIAITSSAVAVDLRWYDNSSTEESFDLERSTTDDFATPVLIAELRSDETTYHDETVAAGQVYYYRLRAQNQNGSSPFSDITMVTTPWPDIDGDGIPDTLEGRPYVVGVDDRLVDSDHDGISNAAEYLAGTDPLDSLSTFAITQTSVVQDRAATVTLCFPTVAGREYFVDFNRSLRGGVWTLVPESDFIGDGTIQCRSDTFLDPVRFYRAHVVRP